MLKWWSKASNILIAIWVVISILILLCVSFFRINDYINQPQHGHFNDFDVVTRFIKENNKLFLYRIYFVLDFIWAFFLLAIIRLLLKELENKKFFSIGSLNITVYGLFVIIATFAFVFDAIEGLCYLFNWEGSLKKITSFKVILYIFCFAFVAYWFLKKYIIPHVKSIIRFVKTSFLSIFFILIVYALITLMPQGGTLIVDLFYSPINIVLFFFLLSFLSIILSHYPIYVDIWANADNECVTLKMGKRGIRILGFGIIYYNTIKNNSEKVMAYNNKIVVMLRRSLGVLLYVAVFNIFLGIISRFFEINFNIVQATILILVITLTTYHFFGEEYIEWGIKLKSKNTSAKQKKEIIIKITKLVKWFPLYLAFCLVLVFMTAIAAHFTQWSRISLRLMILTLTCQMFLYLYFRICRTYFKYIFYSEKLKEFNSDMFDPVKEELFKKYATNPNRGKSWLLFQIGKLSDNIQYLQMMQLSGYVALLLIGISNFDFDFATSLNPINIILLYIILFYSIIIIAFKHVLYYHRNENTSTTYKDFFKYGIPVFTLILIAWSTYNGRQGNDLHQLSFVERDNPQMESSEFLKSVTNGNNSDKINNYFFVGSYGGGLKANLWNLLLLNKLEENSNQEFLKRTIAMSGVSGGAVGMANYASLLYEQEDKIAINKQINVIGNSNVLSNELVYLLGRDWAREYIPYYNHKGTDRSYKSMEQHAINTGMGDSIYNKIGFSDYWRRIFESRKGKFPALIINTTSTNGKQGVASTVKFPKGTFPAADLINEFPGTNKALAYFGAVSTTNRFPLFSPTAKILNKGSYLDGGYFENSGMLSVLEVYDAIVRDTVQKYAKKINPVFVNIINSEDYYISEQVKEWIDDYDLKKKNLVEAGEFAAIIGTVASIDKLPRYVFEKIHSRGFAIEPIMMPHKITYEKIKSVIKADIDNPIKLMELIDAHNKIIDSVLDIYEPYKLEKWGVVQPPLARVLSKPAVHYQEAMVTHHPDVKDALNRIRLYVKADTLVTKDMQEILLEKSFSRMKFKKY